MAHGTYYVISETTEDRFGEVASLDEALLIARRLVRESQTGDPISIEHNGKVIHQLVRTPAGVVEEALVQ